MAGKTLGAAALVRSTCVLLLLVCILFFVLPCTHDCGGEDCPICILKNMFPEIFLTVCLFGILPFLTILIGYFVCFLKCTAPQTLVHLKVKLSD